MKTTRTLYAISISLLLLVSAFVLGIPAAAQAPHGTLRVLHSAPTAPSINVAVEGQAVISDLAYGQHSDPVQVGAPGYGFYRIDIVPVGVSWNGATSGIPAIASIDLSFAPGQIRTLQLIESAKGLQLAVVNPDSALLPQTGAGTHTVAWLISIGLIVSVSGLVLRRRASFRYV